MSGHGLQNEPDLAEAPAWAWSTVALIAAMTFALAATLISAVAWQIHRAELEEHRSLYMASAVSEVTRLAGDDRAHNFITALARQSPDMVEAFVISQGSSDAYGISRGQSYTATMVGDERGKAIGPLAAADPRTVPEAVRHKTRYDRYARVVTGLEVTATPGRASPRFALAIDETPEGPIHAAQVAVDRKAPGAAGVAMKAAVPSPPLPWFLLMGLALGIWAVSIGVFHAARDRLDTVKKQSIALISVVLVGALAIYFGAGAAFDGHLEDQVERRLNDVRTVEKACVDSGLTPTQAAIIAVEADVDFTGARGLLLGTAEAALGARIDAATDRLFAGRYKLAGALLMGVLAALALFFVLAHRFLIKTVVACRDNPFAYLYVMPSMTGMIVLVFIPFITGVGLSFFAYEAPRYYFAGLGNYAEILIGSEAGDVTFYWTLFVTILWTATNVFLHATIGLGLALLLKAETLRFKKLYRVLLIIPWAIPNYITALIWKGMFNKEFGAVNRFIEAFQGLLGMEPAGVDWLGGSFATAFTANLVTNTWLGFPFMMVVALGALQSIPEELYEAADVDGATPWQKFRHITLPLLKPALFPAIILGAIWTFNMFNVIYLVSGGGPDHSTEILITDAYRAFAMLNRYGLAAAYSVLIFVILFFYTVMTNRITKATEGAFE